jgi:hypothetical protein
MNLTPIKIQTCLRIPDGGDETVFEVMDMNSTVIWLTAQKALLHMDGMVCVVLSFICSGYRRIFFCAMCEV